MLVPCPVAWPFARPFSKGIHMQNLHSTLWEETLRFLATNFSHSSGHAMLLCLERCFFFSLHRTQLGQEKHIEVVGKTVVLDRQGL